MGRRRNVILKSVKRLMRDGFVEEYRRPIYFIGLSTLRRGYENVYVPTKRAYEVLRLTPPSELPKPDLNPRPIYLPLPKRYSLDSARVSEEYSTLWESFRQARERMKRNRG